MANNTYNYVVDSVASMTPAEQARPHLFGDPAPATLVSKVTNEEIEAAIVAHCTRSYEQVKALGIKLK